MEVLLFVSVPQKRAELVCFISCLFLGEFLGDYIKYLALLVLAFLQWVILFIEFVFMILLPVYTKQPLPSNHSPSTGPDLKGFAQITTRWQSCVLVIRELYSELPLSLPALPPQYLQSM